MMLPTAAAMTTRRKSLKESWGALMLLLVGARFESGWRARRTSAACSGPAPYTSASSALTVARAARDQSFAPPLLEDALHLLVRVVECLRRRHSSRRHVGEHGRQYERVEHLTLGRVGRSRVPNVSRPLQRGADRLELVGRIGAERGVRRGLLEPALTRRGLCRERVAG